MSVVLPSEVTKKITFKTLNNLSQKIEHTVTLWPSHPTPRCISREITHVHTKTCTRMFTVAKNWKKKKNPKCSPADGQVDKMWHIYKIEFYFKEITDECFSKYDKDTNLKI